MTTFITATGLDDLELYFRTAPEKATLAARLAINDTASRKGMKLIRGKMLDEIAFPAGYLTGDRLTLTKRATNASLEAVITGRKRATSLARFVSGAASPNVRTNGVTVRVRRGKTTVMRNAFLVRLKQGASMTEDNYNIGLAVRLGPGETVGNKRTSHKSWLVPGRVALLYGPSVDQVFRTVADDVAPELGSMLSNEFFRQFARLTRG